MSSEDTGHANRLAGEKSPYLLQHAQNPVDWFPWGEEAFTRARAEDKPIFLSVGYSTCHWCHVMEEESFEDEGTAAQMNATFINIKVDREERPDIDRIYMTFIQAIAGHGGWPMSVWLTPDLKPIWGGTYFPREPRRGQPGFKDVMAAIAEAWKTDRTNVEQVAEQAVDELRELSKGPATKETLSDAPLARALNYYRSVFDADHGGFAEAPKFPRPVVLSLLWQLMSADSDNSASTMALRTLRAMAKGGMCDHVGGGFHRYSTDRRWHVPHFEKMLYDQAQLAKSYLAAYRVTHESLFARTARGTLDYVLGDLTDPESGAFYSAEDADSLPDWNATQRREGAFYVWTYQELAEILSDDFEFFTHHFDVSESGNAEDPHGELRGVNVLRRAQPDFDATARSLDFNEEDLELRLTKLLIQLREGRGKRPRPRLDDKILTGWNGLFISALAKAYQVLGTESDLRAAERAATWLRDNLYEKTNAKLFRRFRAGECALDGCMEDYAQLSEGLLDLYEADFDPSWLAWADELARTQVDLFMDAQSGGFYSTHRDARGVIVRMKDAFDGAEPSANSLAACNFLRLSEMTGNKEWRDVAENTLRAFNPLMRELPHALPLMLVALDWYFHPPVRIVVTGERHFRSTQELLAVAQSTLSPGEVLLLASDAFRKSFDVRLPPSPADSLDDNRGVAYVCREDYCEEPVDNPEQLAEILGKQRVLSAEQ